MSFAAELRVDIVRALGTIQPFVYGQFTEHVGRAIYGGIYDPGSPFADAQGIRTDVLEAARGLQPTLLRWPGGNFASGYHWRDGVGPVEERPTRRDLSWNALDSNAFGTEEFLAYARALGAEAYLNLNVSTGTVDEALAWLEYCNASDGVADADMRRAGPHPEPHGVRVWGIGNENYGWWQHGHTSAERYAEVAREWGKLLRWADPSIELVAVGATENPDWNWKVLSDAGRFIDYLSLHSYWNGGEDAYHATVAGPAVSERDIIATWGMCLAAQRVLKLPRPVRLAIDEWGVWSHSISGYKDLDLGELMRNGLNSRSGIDTRFEEDYDLKDALAVASWLHVLWRHPEKIGLATQAQMVNVIAPIHVHAGGVVRHAVYHPLAIAREHAGPVALDVHVSTPDEIPAPGAQGGSLPALDAAGTWDPHTRRLHVSIVNRSRDEDAELRLDGLGGTWRRITLWHEDPFAGNTIERPSEVVPCEDTVDLASPLRVPAHAHVTLVREGA